MAFGERLRQLREANGFTQETLARAAGVHQQSIARWERGQREPDWSVVCRLADALGVPLEAFRIDSGEGEP
jgi:transcriptional regulator with XRE-family HTH domain